MFTPADVDANIFYIYLNDRMNPEWPIDR